MRPRARRVGEGVTSVLEALEPRMLVTWWDEPEPQPEGFPIDGEYAARFWLPIVGPSAMWIARLLAREVKLAPFGGVWLDMASVAVSVGLHDDLSKSGAAANAVFRLVRYGLARREGSVLELRAVVGHVPPGMTKRFPLALQRAAEKARMGTHHSLGVG